jgi:hypothetical protein
MSRSRALALLLISLPVAVSAAPRVPAAPAAKPATPALVSLRFEPREVRLDRPGAARGLLVTGRYADGSERDLTRAAALVSLRPAVVRAEAGGRILPVTDGSAVVVAKFGGLRAEGLVRVTGQARTDRWHYVNRIAPILTHAGCNGGGCHGSPVGKGGFRLSLFNGAPADDYRAIARDGHARRVNPQEPAQSVLLRKPTLGLPHKGGKRIEVNSPEYRVLAEWIAAGAPEGDPREPGVISLEVLPKGRVLTAANQAQQLVVIAHYADGTNEDVTSSSVFTSNDEGVAAVDAKGRVTAVGQGEAPILVRYAGQVTAAVVGATTQPVVADFPRVAADNPVDRAVFPKLQALHVRPAALCSDAEFLRRVSLDLTATLPTGEEARAFLADRAGTVQERRARLVERLLSKPEYADHQALLWADRLRSNSRFHRVGGVRCYQKWLKESFLANMPLDEFARKLVTARGENYSDGPSNFWGNYDVISTPVEIAPQVSQLFLGVRLHCAQCHNHPFERWTQSDFFSLASVFAHVQGRGTKNTQEFQLFLDPKVVVEHPNTGAAMPPKAPDSPVFAPGPEGDQRLEFAAWLTTPENPFFARAMVNRLWRQMMGRGLVEPVDDFRVTNPATHPELLDALAGELASHRFDQKHVLRLIANSRAYQAASEPNPSNAGDLKFYSRAYPKRLAAEIYLDAVCQVTGAIQQFKDWPEAKRAIQLPENRFPSYFLDTFGRPNRLVICEREQEGTISQALNLINGRELHDRVTAKDGRLSGLLKSGRPDSEVVDELFLATLTRPPREEERSRLARQMANAPNREEAFQDLLWAILASREFQFNH